MLITFHSCVVLIFQILKNRKRLKLVPNPVSNPALDESDLENLLTFDPPVYRQRYSRVYETLLNEKWRNNIQKLVDFGCAEYGLFIYIKNLNIEQVLFVDIDETILQEKIGIIEPLLVDNLRRRNSPLEVSVFSGSVADPDYRLRKTDVVTAIELIEHLYPDTLDAFPYNVFAFIEPKLVIITTPNVDFNVLFNRDGFRHPDHKFEWTRRQFEDWANNIVKRFPNYTVQFSGVGQGPEGTEYIGCCSQMALFLRKDLINPNYISSQYAKACFCDKNSLCKGQTTESKLLCSCLCPLCLPDFSVGICTYSSCSKDIDFKNINRESYSSKKYSDTNLEYKPTPTYYTFENKSKLPSYINPSYNIHYNLIQKIDYPYEIDPRSENERLLHMMQYRIHTFSHCNSRFYVSENERCEIPVTDIMYGDIDVSVEEISHLLINAGYQIEKCIFQETGSCEDCIISVPREMEDITSSSEVTDGYSSKSSEPNDSTKFEANKESLSDWDEVTYSPITVQQGTPSSSVESSSELKKPNPDPLFDSGYLKSPSPLENTSKLPQSPPQENPELAETDQFEDVVSTPSLSSEDNKLHLKKTVAKEKFAPPLMLESQKQKYDPNRVNELDRFHNMSTAKTFMNNYLKPQTEFKKGPFKDLSVAGPSSSWKKSRKLKASTSELPQPTAEKKIIKGVKNVEKKITDKKEIIEPSPLDDAKSITNCIIQNSLNRIDVGDEIVNKKAELIRDFNPPPLPPEADIIVIQDQPELAYVDALDIVPELLPPPQGVENGDLANNNRDNEGNNFVADIQEQDIDEGIDLLNDNLEELVPILEDNLNVFDNNNDLVVEGHNIEVAMPVEYRNIEEVEENFEGNGAEHDCDLEADDSVAHASREALFDANSEQDLLEDFDIPPQAIHDDIFDVLNLGSSVLLVGLHPISSSGTRMDQSPGAASIQTNTNSFPNWLLQILGNHVATDDPVGPLGTHDEPHFYCQGDGLGVHPSVIAVDVDEAEDADNDTSTEDSSSNNTADFAEVEPGPSDMFDMSSLPEESSVATSLMDDNTGHPLRAGGSVVWTERESNDNDDDPPPIELSISEDDALLVESIANGENLVNDIIRTAVQEVALRSQQTSETCVRAPKNSEEDVSSLETVSPPQSCCLVPMSDSNEVIKPDERRKKPKAEPVGSDQGLLPQSNSHDVPRENSPNSEEETMREVQSSSGSDQSEYYET